MRQAGLLAALLFAAACGGGDGNFGAGLRGGESENEAGGPGGGSVNPEPIDDSPYVPPCTGKSAACEGRAWLDCPWELGCDWEASTCAGTPTPCSERTDILACSEGCRWDVVAEACSGRPYECVSTEEPELCVRGCEFTAGFCFAEVDGCERIFEKGVCVQSGCTWNRD